MPRFWFISAKRSRRVHGLTLVELLTVLSVMVVLITLAAPSFKHTIQSTNISSQVNGFLADLRLARSSAMRLGGSVILCRSDAPEAANPVCSSSTNPLGWASGWIVFQDLNNDGGRNASEPLLHVQSPISSVDAITETSNSASTVFRFTATGRMFSSGSATQLKFGGGNFGADLQRTVCVNLAGRARIAGDGSSSCSTDR